MNTKHKTKIAEKNEASTQKTLDRDRKWSFLRRTPQFINRFEAPNILKKIRPYVKEGQVVADIGCGWGYYTFLLVELVGPQGKIYSVDLGESCIQYIEKKANSKGYTNISGVATTAADLSSIKDNSVNFIFSNGLLCSMENDRPLAVKEMQRILKPDGFAYISLGAAPPFGLVDEREWKEILSKFKIYEGGPFKDKWVIAGPKS